MDPDAKSGTALGVWLTARRWHGNRLSGPSRTTCVSAVFVAVSCVAGIACSSTSDDDIATQQRLAEQLIGATKQAGVAPRLTVDVAESLYGTDARAVCAAFDGGTSTVGDHILLGNLAQGRRKTITDDAASYAGLVIQIYCPEVLSHFAEVVADLDLVEASNR